MVSFIVAAKDKKTRIAYHKAFTQKHSINTFDVTTIERDTESKTTGIGIETIKLLQKKLFLKPIKSENKLLIIEDAQLLTPEAQNALLKVLEEPPEHTYIILGTETTEALLSTILSRCQIIELEESRKQLSEKSIEELTLFIKALPELTLAQRLSHAEKLAKDKDKAITWIENLIIVLRDNLIQTNSLETAESIKKLQVLHTLLKTTNVNSRFAIEHTLLGLSQVQ